MVCLKRIVLAFIPAVAAFSATSPTASYLLNHAMLQMRDANVTLPFYQNVLGMTVVASFELPNNTVHFVGYHGEHTNSTNLRNREGLLELWFPPDLSTKTLKRATPLGFGHIGISVDDVQAAYDRFVSLNVTILQTPAEGGGVAMIADPDGYNIEILPRFGILG